jgi:hypothetical protein
MSYFCSLRDRTSGRYWQAEIGRTLGETDADRLLRTAHQVVFAGWLRLTLRQQREDIELLLPVSEADRRSFLFEWAGSAPYRDFPPAGVEEGERLLYLCDMDALTALLYREYGVEMLRRSWLAVVAHRGIRPSRGMRQ